MAQSNETRSKYLNIERAAVRSVGGLPNPRLLGPDGITRGVLRRPIEVKYADKDSRFRINKKDHEIMLKYNGIYIFIDRSGNSKTLPASFVNRLLAYKWLKDRDYPHSFVFVKTIFG